jgi:hypothetical protein
MNNQLFINQQSTINNQHNQQRATSKEQPTTPRSARSDQPTTSNQPPTINFLEKGEFFLILEGVFYYTEFLHTDVVFCDHLLKD